MSDCPWVSTAFAPGPQRVESGEYDPDFVAQPVGYTAVVGGRPGMTNEPKRIHRRRTKGWRMPEGAVYVGRPTEWGNPWRVGEPILLDWEETPGRRLLRELVITPGLAVELYRIAFTPDAEEIRAELAGCDLVCWCPLDHACHADVLLEVANR